jgi:hypothetical protein
MDKVPSNGDCYDSLTNKQKNKLLAYQKSLFAILNKIALIDEDNEYLDDLVNDIGNVLLESIPEYAD